MADAGRRDDAGRGGAGGLRSGDLHVTALTDTFSFNDGI